MPPQTPTSPKPYDFVPIDHQACNKAKGAGHDRFYPNRLHGYLNLAIEAKTAVHVSTGVLALGEDLGIDADIAQPMTQRPVSEERQVLIIQGSSFKGAVRSVYEAITQSTLTVSDDRIKNNNLAASSKKHSLSPAERIFGAMGYQGLLRFGDALCDASPEAGFMPVMYQPGGGNWRQYYLDNGKLKGRKFYYHTARLAAAEDGHSGVKTQQAPAGAVFATQIHFKNLTEVELGTLLLALGQDAESNEPAFALKLGGGKPMGFGSVTIRVEAVKTYNMGDRYSCFSPTGASDGGTDVTQSQLDEFMHTGKQELVMGTQLDKLTEILKYPSQRQPPTKNY